MVLQTNKLTVTIGNLLIVLKKWYIRGKKLSIYPFLTSTVPLSNQIVDKRKVFFTDTFLLLNGEA